MRRGRPTDPTWDPARDDAAATGAPAPARHAAASPNAHAHAAAGADPSGPGADSGPGAASGPAVTTEPIAAEAAPWRDGHDARYLRDGLLGRGGMGMVYLARDRRLDRAVALKESVRGGEMARRLAREAKVTAGLDHPGIVTVHDCGVTEDGRPFYTMRLLRGRPLSAVLAEQTALAGRLALLRHYLDACNAVAFAHAEGVVHRDVKPANIMIGRFGETQVVDWGLATAIGTTEPPSNGGEAKDARETRTGAALGTPAYMSPEQARGEPAGPRADVWSLGAVLYELLTGRRPREGGTGEQLVDRARQGDTPSLVGVEGPPELVAIAERALAADPARRYPDAGALAADVAAFFEGRRVDAHRYTSWELLSRLVRAWRAPLAVAAIATMIVVGLGAAGTWRIARERDRVVAAERDTRLALGASDANFAQALVTEARNALASGSSAVASVLASRAIALADAPEAWGVLAATAVEARAERLSEAPLPRCESHLLYGEGDVVCVATHDVSRVVDGTPAWTWTGIPSWVRVEPDTVYVATGDRMVALDAATGAPRAGDWRPAGAWGRRGWPLVPGEWGFTAADFDAHPIMAALCPRSSLQLAVLSIARGAYAGVCDDGRVALGRVGAPPDRHLPTPASYAAFAGVAAAELSAEGRFLVLAGTKGDLAVVDLETGETTRDVTADRDAAYLLAISADATRVAIAGDRGDVEVRELPSLARIARVPMPRVRDVRFLPDGALLVAGAETTSRWRLPRERTPHALASASGLTSAVFSPDGRWLATGHGRGEAQVWELPSGRRVAGLDIGVSTAKSAAWTADGSTAWFAVTGPSHGAWRPLALRSDGRAAPEVTAAALDAPASAAGLPTAGALNTRRIGVLASGLVVGLPYILGELFTFDPARGAPAPVEGCPRADWFDLGQPPGGERLVLVGEGGVLALIEPGPPARCVTTLSVPGAVAADVDSTGTRLAVGTGEGVLLLDAAGREQWRADHPGRLLDVSVSPDGRWVAAGFGDHTARLWEGATGRLRAVLPGHRERVSGVDFRPDGALLATASWDGTARLWRLDVLDEPAAALDARAPSAWGLTLEAALDAAGR